MIFSKPEPAPLRAALGSTGPLRRVAEAQWRREPGRSLGRRMGDG